MLVDVPEDSAAVREETFGPTLTVTRVRDADEAVREGQRVRVRARRRGLRQGPGRGDRPPAAVRDGQRQLGAHLRGIGALPFGGVGDSGFGRIHGEDGLREFARSKAVTRQRFPSVVDVTRFDRHPAAIKRLTMIVGAVYGRAPRRAVEPSPGRPHRGG